jgi:hypothetical protein
LMSPEARPHEYHPPSLPSRHHHPRSMTPDVAEMLLMLCGSRNQPEGTSLSPEVTMPSDAFVDVEGSTVEDEVLPSKRHRISCAGSPLSFR